MIIRYKECMKNHAATLGGNATNGCGEFMATREEGTFEALNPSEQSYDKDYEDVINNELENPSEKVKKRFITKFKQENKEKMLAFVEGRVEDAKARGIYSVEVLPKAWNQEESPQSMDAQ
ncbi:hypothetical protein RJT34_16693 [Clitoria ternatea]|uniref:ZF-HD dimerization-type domain-containing protein n=1 Tax=Clitoria ternatea TaxID=43366 RepID=A0AAN9J9P1_CLITE